MASYNFRSSNNVHDDEMLKEGREGRDTCTLVGRGAVNVCSNAEATTRIDK